MSKNRYTKCHICGANVLEDRFQRHINKVHGEDKISQTPYKQQKQPVIKTKLIKEIQPGKFVALGYGDIAKSELQLVVVSSFFERFWTPDSAIGSIVGKVGKDFVSQHWPESGKPGDAILIDLSKSDQKQNVSFQYIIIIFTGYYEPRSREEWVSRDIWLQVGLSNVSSKIRNLHGLSSIDITALGTQYGAIERQRTFDIISQWAFNLFKIAPRVDLIRITTNDLDTFIDLFESLYKIPDWTSSTSLGNDINRLLSGNLGEFTSDIQTIMQSIENPGATITLCRRVVEKIVKLVYSRKAKQYPGNLSAAIDGLNSIAKLPPQFHAYLDLVRRLGNFAIHNNDQLNPEQKDAEITVSLLLRVIDYWETNKDVI